MITPTAGNVFVKRMPTVQHGPIHLPQNSIHDSDVLKLQVVAVGGPRRTRKGAMVVTEVSEGDVVLWHSYASGPVEVGPETYCVKASEILAVIRNEIPQGPLPAAQG